MLYKYYVVVNHIVIISLVHIRVRVGLYRCRADVIVMRAVST